MKYYFRAAKDITSQELTVATDFNKDEGNGVSVFQKQERFPSISLKSGQIIALSGKNDDPWMDSFRYLHNAVVSDGRIRPNKQ